jgi:hypothetical protein
VTNRHVIKSGFPVIRLNNQDGGVEVIEKKQEDWIFTDENDIAVCQVGLWPEIQKFKAVNVKDFVTHDLVNNFNIGIGDIIFLVGRFVNHEGKQRNLPTARFGHISMMPLEPVYHPSNRPEEQDSFLVEVQTRNAYSGSPVFVFIEFAAWNRYTQLKRRPSEDPNQFAWGDCMYFFLGIEWGQIRYPVKISGKKEEYIEESTGMVGVVPAWRLQDLLDGAGLQLQREKEDQARAEKQLRNPVTLESAAEKSESLGGGAPAPERESR